MNKDFNMQPKGIQAILAEVEKPSRYLGTEVNRVIKDPSACAVRMALAFPDLYEIGTSHFGIQILYHLLNQEKEIAAERVFAPAKDMEAALRRTGTPLCSLESQTPLRQFDIVGFSLLYELNYTNVLNMLDLADIPLYSDRRGDGDPLIIAGGPCVSNPEPMAPFFDAMVFGDGEEVLPRMVATWLEWKKQESASRADLLARWARLEGVYIPAFFEATYNADGFQILTPIRAEYSRVTRAVVADLDRTFFPERPVVAFGNPIHDRLRLEISRGCSRGCRFCQAGMIYRPVRERAMGTLLDLCDRSLAATGYEDLSLLSLSTGDYTCLSPLIAALMQRCQSDRVAVSLPSIRAGTLTPELMAQIKKVRKTGFTIAPEAGSQRLRDVINKNIRFEDVEATVTDAFALGWQVIKLYFMLGLPTETDEDVEAITQMVTALKKVKGPARRRGQLNVSVTTFIPKAHTPFQWAAQLSMTEAFSKIESIKSSLRMSGVQVKWQHPAMSQLEGVMARGDRRLALVIERAWRSGCTFDGWTEHFNFNVWQQAFDECAISIDFFTTRVRALEEPLPWAHMDARIDADFLKAQWAAAQAGLTTDDCRTGACHQCGACDFQTIAPRRFAQSADDSAPVSILKKDIPILLYRRMQLLYSKHGNARFFGHLEVAKLFARALRRAHIDVLYSQGYHPMPRISFDDPLPLGMESCGERMWIRVAPQVSCEELVDCLCRQMPEGIQVSDCRVIPANTPKSPIMADRYHIVWDLSDEDAVLLAQFYQQDAHPYTRNRKGSSQSIDLKQSVQLIERIDAHMLRMVILRNTSFAIRPADVLRGVLQADEEKLARTRIIKLAPEF